MSKVVIGHYYYVTTMNENVNWMKVTHMLSMSFLNFKATFTSRFLISLLNVHTVENLYLSLVYISMYANASNNIPSYTHVHSYVVWRVHLPGQHSPFEVFRPLKGSLEPLRVILSTLFHIHSYFFPCPISQQNWCVRKYSDFYEVFFLKCINLIVCFKGRFGSNSTT